MHYREGQNRIGLLLALADHLSARAKELPLLFRHIREYCRACIVLSIVVTDRLLLLPIAIKPPEAILNSQTTINPQMAIDVELVRKAQCGDRAAFERLLDLSYALIFRFAYRWCNQREIAEDITQLACMKLAKAIKHFRFESAYKSWLYRLVINTAKDWQRKEYRHKSETLADDERAQLAATSSEMVEAPRELIALLERVDRLGEGFKATVLLVHAEGYTHKEAADILGLKESTISWRLHEIRKALKLNKGASA